MRWPVSTTYVEQTSLLGHEKHKRRARKKTGHTQKGIHHCFSLFYIGSASFIHKHKHNKRRWPFLPPLNPSLYDLDRQNFEKWEWVLMFILYLKWVFKRFKNMDMVYSSQQGGRHQKNIGWALCSNDDVIISMTSLLLIFPSKILGGLKPPLAPPWFNPWATLAGFQFEN